jgi:hypothetical protein
MKSLQEIYTKNAGKASLFSSILDIDFYDGPTEAVCQLADSHRWFICSLVYIDIELGKRIFTMLEINDESVSHFKSLFERIATDRSNIYHQIKDKVRVIYKNYSGKVFLFKGDWLNASEYKIVQILLSQLKYFRDIDEVLGQSEESKLKWERFFFGTE